MSKDRKRYHYKIEMLNEDGQVEMIPENMVKTTKLIRDGYKNIVYVDESGLGTLAGDVIAVAVMLRPDYFNEKIRDSKQFKSAEHLTFYKLIPKIEENVLLRGIGRVTIHERNSIQNEAEVSRLAKKRAIENLGITPDKILIDGQFSVYGSEIEECIIDGDRKVFGISVASMLAKYLQNSEMENHMHSHYRNHGFIYNHGYPTDDHMLKIHKYGITPIHLYYVTIEFIEMSFCRTKRRMEKQEVNFNEHYTQL